MPANRTRMLRRKDGALFVYTPELAKRDDMREVMHGDRNRPRQVTVDAVTSDIESATSKRQIKAMAEDYGIEMDMHGSLQSLRVKLAAMVEAQERDQGNDADSDADSDAGADTNATSDAERDADSATHGDAERDAE